MPAERVSEKYSTHIPEEERDDLVSAYARRLTSDDDQVSLEAAKHWSTWETSTARLFPDADNIRKAQEDVRWTRWVPALALVPLKLISSCQGVRAHRESLLQQQGRTAFAWGAERKGFFPEDGYLIQEAQISKM